MEQLKETKAHPKEGIQISYRSRTTEGHVGTGW